MFGAHRGVVQSGGDGVGVQGLAFLVLQQIGLGTLEQADLARARSEAYGVLAGFGAVAAGLIAVQTHALVVQEGVHDADGVGAAAHAGADGVGMVDAVLAAQLLLGLLADDLLEIADDGRERVRSGHGAEQVVGGLHVGDPVAQRLVDGVLEDAGAELDLHHLGAEQSHAGHVQRLAAGVHLTHVDTALEPEQRADRGRGHTVLAGAGLRDHAGLAHALDQQGLAERVVDLVGAGVVQILTLEEHARVDADAFVEPLREPRHLGQRRGPSDVQPVEAVELLAERGIGLGLVVYLFEFGQRVDQGLGHEAAAEPAEIRAVMLRQRTAFRHLHAPAGLHQPLDGQSMTFGGGHALAHQHGVRTGAGVVLQFHRAEHAGFRHLDDVLRQRRGQFPIIVHVDGQVLEIACVDADDGGARLHRAFDLLGGVGLHQRRHAEFVGQVQELAQRGIVQSRHDQQHDISAMRPRLPDLIRGGDEVLAQHGDMNGGTHAVEVVQRTEEPAPFGQHRDGRRASALVFGGQRRGIGDIGQMPLGRRGAFDLGDDGHGIGMTKPSAGVQRSGGRGRGLLHCVQWHGLFAGTLILQCTRHQFVKYRHGFSLVVWLGTAHCSEPVC